MRIKKVHLVFTQVEDFYFITHHPESTLKASLVIFNYKKKTFIMLLILQTKPLRSQNLAMWHHVSFATLSLCPCHLVCLY